MFLFMCEFLSRALTCTFSVLVAKGQEQELEIHRVISYL